DAKVLADLYRALGRPEEAASVLAAELALPGSPEAAQLRRELEAALAAAQNERAPESFADAVRAWIDEHGPAWVPYALPRGLDDPRLGDVGAALRERPAGLGDPEYIALRLVAASAAEAPLSDAQRADAFAAAVAALLWDARSASEARALVRSVIE